MVHPNARNWMWNYCIYLGEWIDPKSGKTIDLGVYAPEGDTAVSEASVFGPNDGDYYSGEIICNGIEEGWVAASPRRAEVVKRYNEFLRTGGNQ